ncbi:MAG TPA: ABC transporter permease [Bryobacteraceae bacterium]|nr:ABC transporter permease [Bryobacteraceae bacterium]
MHILLSDLRYAFRMLRKAPGFTAAAVLTLALGIGLNTAIFSVVHTVLIQDLPYRQPDRLIDLHETEPQLPKAPVTMPDLIAWRERSHSFEAISSFRPEYAALTGGDRPERLPIMVVTPDFFSTLGVQPALGRSFSAEEGTKGHDAVVILSHGVFQRYFGGDRSVIGRTITLDGTPRAVVGIMPRRFQLLYRFQFPVDAWIPMVLVKGGNSSHDRFALARLRPAVTLGQAQAEMTAIAAQLQRENPTGNWQIGTRLVPLREDVTGNVHDILVALVGAVGFVLLIACVNVANLLLARGIARGQELAVRAALGAGRARITRQLLTEALLLAVAGGGAGLLLAFAGVHALRFFESLTVPRLAETTINRAVLLYSCLITIGAGLLFGIAPPLSQSRRDLNTELRQSGERTVAGSGHATNLRGVLVAAEMGLAVVLLIGAGLMVRSVVRLLAVDPGFRPEGVITMQLSAPSSSYSTDEKLAAFARALLDRVRAIPGVTAASITNKLPLKGGWNGTVIVEGKPYSANVWEGPLVETSFVQPGYFQAMGIPLRAGRVFTESDLKKGSTAVIANQTFTRQFLPNENAIGRRVSQDREPPHWYEIVGVVGDALQRNLAQPPMPELYWPEVSPYMTLVAHTTLSPTGLIEPIRREVAAIDRDVPISEVHTMQDVLETSSAPARSYMRLIALFAAVALALASIGIYGLVSFTTSQRRHEIGIRMAMGATTFDIVKMALGSASKLVLGGVAAGVFGALILTQYLRSLLYAVSRFDPITFIAVPMFLAAVALAASLIPALRTGRVDVAAALRHE